MNCPLVTIALSAYNVEAYIDDALESIENQSYSSIEILCIDDASTDTTYKKLLSHSKKDSRYRVIRQNINQGLSASRNLAISEAKGKYIIMLDGDDLFDEKMVEKAVLSAEQSNADMVMWDYFPFTSEKQLTERRKEQSNLSNINISDKVSLLKRPAFMWVRMLKIDRLRELTVFFEPGLTKQDIPVHWRLITTLEKIKLISEKLSFYRIQPNATSCRKDRSVFSLAKVMDIVGDYLHKEGLYEQYKIEYLRSRLSLLHGMYDFIKPELKTEAYQMIIERLDNDARAYIKSKNGLGYRTNFFYGKLAGNLFDSLAYNIILGIRSIYRFFK